jgi:hypothetical protein
MYAAALAAVPRVLDFVGVSLSVDYERALELVAKESTDHAQIDHCIEYALQVYQCTDKETSVYHMAG